MISRSLISMVLFSAFLLWGATGSAGNLKISGHKALQQAWSGSTHPVLFVDELYLSRDFKKKVLVKFNVPKNSKRKAGRWFRAAGGMAFEIAHGRTVTAIFVDGLYKTKDLKNIEKHFRKASWKRKTARLSNPFISSACASELKSTTSRGTRSSNTSVVASQNDGILEGPIGPLVKCLLDGVKAAGEDVKASGESVKEGFEATIATSKSFWEKLRNPRETIGIAKAKIKDGYESASAFAKEVSEHPDGAWGFAKEKLDNLAKFATDLQIKAGKLAEKAFKDFKNLPSEEKVKIFCEFGVRLVGALGLAAITGGAAAFAGPRIAKIFEGVLEKFGHLKKVEERVASAAEEAERATPRQRDAQASAAPPRRSTPFLTDLPDRQDLENLRGLRVDARSSDGVIPRGTFEGTTINDEGERVAAFRSPSGRVTYVREDTIGKVRYGTTHNNIAVDEWEGYNLKLRSKSNNKYEGVFEGTTLNQEGERVLLLRKPNGELEALREDRLNLEDIEIKKRPPKGYVRETPIPQPEAVATPTPPPAEPQPAARPKISLRPKVWGKSGSVVQFEEGGNRVTATYVGSYLDEGKLTHAFTGQDGRRFTKRGKDITPTSASEDFAYRQKALDDEKARKANADAIQAARDQEDEVRRRQSGRQSRGRGNRSRSRGENPSASASSSGSRASTNPGAATASGVRGAVSRASSAASRAAQATRAAGRRGRRAAGRAARATGTAIQRGRGALNRAGNRAAQGPRAAAAATAKAAKDIREKAQRKIAKAKEERARRQRQKQESADRAKADQERSERESQERARQSENQSRSQSRQSDERLQRQQEAEFARKDPLPTPSKERGLDTTKDAYAQEVRTVDLNQSNPRKNIVNARRILNITDENYTKADVTAKKRSLSQKYHPEKVARDNPASVEQALEVQVQINKAIKILNDNVPKSE